MVPNASPVMGLNVGVCVCVFAEEVQEETVSQDSGGWCKEGEVE